MDKKGNRVSGKSLAPDETALRADLRRQGIAVSRVKKQCSAFKSGGKVKAEDIAVFSRQLATMLAAGIPLVQSFEIVGNGNDKPAMQKLILDIKADVEGGTSLHEALGKHPLHFDDLFVNLVEAGEQAGALETLLDKIATYKEKTEALKKKVKKALFYPTAVLVVAVIVTDHPAHFRHSAVRGPVQGLRRRPAGVHADRHQHVALAAGQRHLLRHGRGRRRLRVRLLPQALEGDARVARPHVAQVADHRTHPEQVGHRALRAHAVHHVRRRRAAGRSARVRRRRHAATSCSKTRCMKMRDEVATGQRLQRAMENTGLFPNMVIQMIAVGEEAGALDDMSGKVATFYEAEVDNAVDSMSSLLEPLIMAILGVLVGGLVIAMYLPIFKLGAVV